MKIAKTYLEAARQVHKSKRPQDAYSMDCDLFDRFWLHDDTCDGKRQLATEDPQVIVLYLCLMDAIAKNP